MNRLGSLAFIRQPVLEKESSELKPVKNRLKIDFVSHPACAGVGKYIYMNALDNCHTKRIGMFVYDHVGCQFMTVEKPILNLYFPLFFKP